MKKFYGLLLAFFLFLIIPVVKAEDKKFELVNSTKLGYVELVDANYDKTSRVDGDYIVRVHNYLRRVRKDESIVWEKEMDTLVAGTEPEYFIEGEYIYYTFIGRNNSKVVKARLSDGSIVKENTNFGGFYINRLDDKIVVVSLTSVKTLDNDLNVVKEITNELNASSYINNSILVDDNKLYYLLYNEDNGLSVIGIGILDSNLNYTSINLDYPLEYENTGAFFKLNDDFYAVNRDVYKITKEGHVTREIVGASIGQDGNYYVSGDVVGNYIVLGGTDFRAVKCIASHTGTGSDSTEPTLMTSSGKYCYNEVISVFDLDFKYLYDLPVSKSGDPLDGIIINISPIYKGFVAKETREEDHYFGLIEYNQLFNIVSHTDGNGEIEVVSSAYGGESITFRVLAKSGYKLDTLTVTSSSGETVIFREEDITTNEDGTMSITTNLFTMPFEDVVIYASWKEIVDVPSTGLSVGIFSILIIVSGLSYYSYRKNKKAFS